MFLNILFSFVFWGCFIVTVVIISAFMVFLIVWEAI